MKVSIPGLNWELISISNIVEQSVSENIPILLIAYCRPIEFSRIASDLESLPQRRIEISIDGPVLETESENKSVVDLAISWKSKSKHEIDVWVSERNLGLFEHFSAALQRFFSRNQWGLVLEDDLEFRGEIVQFLDTNEAKNLLDTYFSFCGNNPLSDLSSYRSNHSIRLQETNIHTISGWASSASSIHLFLELLKDSRSDGLLLENILKNFCHNITRDPLLARSLFNNWSGKIQRAVRTSKPNWDNYWELAAWSSGKPSIRPTFSLIRESPISFGRQTHHHNFGLEIWPNSSQKLDLEFSAVLPLKKTLEIQALGIWGTSRIRAYKEFLNRLFARRF